MVDVNLMVTKRPDRGEKTVHDENKSVIGAVCNESKKVKLGSFILNSGLTKHMVSDIKRSSPTYVSFFVVRKKNFTMNPMGVGDIRIVIRNRYNMINEIVLNNLLVIPGPENDPMFEDQLTENAQKNYTVHERLCRTLHA